MNKFVVVYSVQGEYRPLIGHGGVAQKFDTLELAHAALKKAKNFMKVAIYNLAKIVEDNS